MYSSWKFAQFTSLDGLIVPLLTSWVINKRVRSLLATIANGDTVLGHQKADHNVRCPQFEKGEFKDWAGSCMQVGCRKCFRVWWKLVSDGDHFKILDYYFARGTKSMKLCSKRLDSEDATTDWLILRTEQVHYNLFFLHVMVIWRVDKTKTFN